MPGRLIHTNEITVLLGDNWFAEVSAKDAIGITERRVAGKYLHQGHCFDGAMMSFCFYAVKQ